MTTLAHSPIRKRLSNASSETTSIPSRRTSTSIRTSVSTSTITTVSPSASPTRASPTSYRKSPPPPPSSFHHSPDESTPPVPNISLGTMGRRSSVNVVTSPYTKIGEEFHEAMEVLERALTPPNTTVEPQQSRKRISVSPRSHQHHQQTAINNLFPQQSSSPPFQESQSPKRRTPDRSLPLNEEHEEARDAEEFDHSEDDHDATIKPLKPTPASSGGFYQSAANRSRDRLSETANRASLSILDDPITWSSHASPATTLPPSSLTQLSPPPSPPLSPTPEQELFDTNEISDGRSSRVGHRLDDDEHSRDPGKGELRTIPEAVGEVDEEGDPEEEIVEGVAIVAEDGPGEEDDEEGESGTPRSPPSRQLHHHQPTPDGHHGHRATPPQHQPSHPAQSTTPNRSSKKSNNPFHQRAAHHHHHRLASRHAQAELHHPPIPLHMPIGSHTLNAANFDPAEVEEALRTLERNAYSYSSYMGGIAANRASANLNGMDNIFMAASPAPSAGVNQGGAQVLDDPAYSYYGITTGTNPASPAPSNNGQAPSATAAVTAPTSETAVNVMSPVPTRNISSIAQSLQNLQMMLQSPSFTHSDLHQDGEERGERPHNPAPGTPYTNAANTAAPTPGHPTIAPPNHGAPQHHPQYTYSYPHGNRVVPHQIHPPPSSMPQFHTPFPIPPISAFSDSTLSPTGTPYQMINPFIQHNGVISLDSMSIRSSPSHLPVVLPDPRRPKPGKSRKLNRKSNLGTSVPPKHKQSTERKSKEQLPDRGMSTEPPETLSEEESEEGTEEGETEDYGVVQPVPSQYAYLYPHAMTGMSNEHPWLNLHSPAIGHIATNGINGHAPPPPRQPSSHDGDHPIDENELGWVDEDDEESDSDGDILAFEHHPSYIRDSVRRRKKLEKGWDNLVTAFKALDRQTSTPMILMAAHPSSSSPKKHQKRMRTLSSRGFRRLPSYASSPELKQLKSSFASLALQISTQHTQLSNLHQQQNNGESQALLQHALSSLEQLSRRYFDLEQRWAGEMVRLAGERRDVDRVLTSFADSTEQSQGQQPQQR